MIIAWFLFIVLFLLLIPIGVLALFLWNHQAQDSDTAIMHQVLLWVVATKFFFLLGVTIIMFMVLVNLNPANLSLYIILLFCIPSVALAVANWWALAKIHKLLKN